MVDLGSISWGFDPKFTFLSGLLFLYLFLQVLKLFLPPFKKKQHIEEHQCTNRRKRGACKGRRTCRREAQEGRKLLSILKSPSSKSSDIIQFRQLLCPDPLCGVCNTTTAKVSQLLCKASLEEAANSVSHVPSKTSPKESSVFLSAVVSAIPSEASIPAPLSEAITSGASISAPLSEAIPSGASISAPLPEAISSGASTSAPLSEPTPITSSALSPDQVTSLPDLALPSSLGHSLPPEPVPHLSSELPVDPSTPQPPVATPSPPHDTQEHSENQNLIDIQYSEPSAESNTSGNIVEPRDLSFVSPDVMLLLERQIKKKGDFLMQKEKKKKTKYCPKELKPDDQLNSAEKVLESVPDQQDSPVSVPLQISKEKSEELRVHHQTPYPMPSEDHFPQFFWGLPSLHSESLSPKVPVSGDDSTYLYFNAMSNFTSADVSPGLPHLAPQSLPEIQSQTLTKTLTQSQSQHSPPPVPPQDQLQFSVPILPPLPSSQVSSCGVCFHKFQDEAQSLAPSEIHKLEYNVLQKGQENVWGLPSVVQKSREEFCPPAPIRLLDRQSSKAYGPTSILLGDFPLKKDVRKKLEHHLRKRLIQHRWGLPRRVHESLSSVNPQTEVPEAAESRSSYGLSWISLFKGQSSKDLRLSQSRSSHARDLELPPLEERVKKVNSPQIGIKGYPLSGPKGAPHNSLDSDLRTDIKNQLSRLLEKKPRASRESSNQKQLTDALEGHLSKKFEEINESVMPDSVHRSWHSLEQLLSCPEKPPSQMKQSDLAPRVGEDKCLNTSQDISFLGSKKQKMLEDHIKLFHKRLMCGLPHKVQESIDIFNTKGTPSWSSFHSKVPSSSSLISGKDSKTGVSKPLKGGFNTSHGDKMGTTNSVSTTDRSLSSTSTVSEESKRALRHSPSHTSRELTENVKTIEGDRQTLLPCQHTDIDKESQTVVANRCSPRLPTRQAGARPKSWNKGGSPNSSIEKPQRKMIKNLEYFPMPNKSREIFKAKELCVVRSQSTNSLMTMESESSSGTDVTMGQVEPSLTTEGPPEGISAPKDSESSDLKHQLLNELKFKMENKEHGLAPGFSTDLSLAFDKLTSKTLLTHLQSASSGDMAASHVLQVHFEKKGISTGQQEEPWIPTHVLCKCQDKNLPLAPRRVCPLAPKTGEFGGGDAGLVTCQPRKRPHHPQDRTLKEALGNKTSPAPSLKVQPPENFRNQIKYFFQWLCHSIKAKGQGGSLKKGSSFSSVQGRHLIKGRAAFVGNTEAQKILTDIEKVLEEKPVGRHGIEFTTPPKPLSTPMKAGKIEHNPGPQVQAEPVQKHAFNLKTPCSKVPGTKSSSQEAGLTGQRYPTRNRWVMDRGRQPQQSVTLQEKLLCQRHHPPMPHKEAMVHPRTTCRCQVGQVPPATPAFAKGSLLGDLSLLFKQKWLLQKVQGEKFLPRK